MSRVRPSTALLLALGAALATPFATPVTAYAYEDQATLGIDLGWLGAPSAAAGVPRNGAALGVSGTLGLNDTWSLGARASYALHPAGRSLHSLIGGVEVIYLVDVLRVVPSLGVGVDGFFTLRDGRAGADLAFHAVLSMDYLLTRRVLVGADVRAYALPFSLDAGGLSPFALSASIRASLTFDRF